MVAEFSQKTEKKHKDGGLAFSSCDKRIRLIHDRKHLVEHSHFPSY